MEASRMCGSAMRRHLAIGALAALLSPAANPAFGAQGNPLSVTPAPAAQAEAQSANRNEPSAAERPRLQKRSGRYRLRPGDMLELTFPFTPEFNQTLAVHPDGYITLRGAGELRAEGQTLPELSQAVRIAYSKILADPVLSADLKDFEKPYFLVGGEVGRPGKFELRGDTTVSEAVAIAGGFRDSAKHSQVLLIRRVSDDLAEVKALNVKKMLRSRRLEEDVHLRPGDMLFVPKNALSKVRPFVPVPGVGFSLNPGVY